MENALPPRREMERATLERDSGYDGIFWLAVRTTGIFCRPTCPARKPRFQNVEFFPTVREAMFAGFRPCRRCRPLEASGAQPEWVKHLLTRLEAAPEGRLRERDLLRLGVEPARARRWFQRHTGMSFQAFARARRLARAFDGAKKGVDVNTLAFDAGYESVSAFRESFGRLFGRAPGRTRVEGAGEPVTIGWAESPLGPLLLGATGSGACLVEFTDRKGIEGQLRVLARRFGRPLVPGETAHLARLREELAGYFAGGRRRFEVPIEFPGTPFERRVWEALLAIPYGETRSYGELAKLLGRPGAARAVGSANGRNRLAIVIPCHRVVNESGELGGYGGGLWRKKWLLELERGEKGIFENPPPR